MSESEEEKILLEREYMKHIENIEKSEMMQRHFELKEVGYNLSVDALHNDGIISVFLGYIEAIGVGKKEIYKGIAGALLDPKRSVHDSIRGILSRRIKDEDAIITEIMGVDEN